MLASSDSLFLHVYYRGCNSMSIEDRFASNPKAGWCQLHPELFINFLESSKAALHVHET